MNDEFTPGPIRATVTNFDMPFISLVMFMVKASLAAIPAFIILFVIYFIVGGMFFASLMHR